LVDLKLRTTRRSCYSGFHSRYATTSKAELTYFSCIRRNRLIPDTDIL